MDSIRTLWISGLSMAGKTTLAKLMLRRLREHGHQSILLDGDEIRELHDNRLGYDIVSRRKQTERIKRLASWAIRQGAIPVVAIVHPFEDDRGKCRRQIPGYYEIHLKCGMRELVKRDTKKLYLPALKGDKKNVVGVDIPFDEPKAPDIEFETDKARPEEIAESLWEAIRNRLHDGGR